MRKALLEETSINFYLCHDSGRPLLMAEILSCRRKRKVEVEADARARGDFAIRKSKCSRSLRQQTLH